jgi:membrane associated rhomboid family serine protease
MWTLWLFGPAIEDRLGHLRYLAFYLACGLAASAAHVMFNPTSIVPALGASGAIAGILGTYMRLFPLAPCRRGGPDPVHPAVLRSLRIRLYRPMVPASSSAIDDRPPAAGCQRRRRVVAHVGGFIAGFGLGSLLVRSEQRYRVYYPDEGLLGFDTDGRL